MKRLLIAYIAIAFACSFCVPAMAQGRRQPDVGFPIPVDPLGLNKGINKTVGEVSSDVASFLNQLADFDGAVKLSTQIPTLQDPVGNACWQQFSPIQALIKAHPLPVSFKVATDIEAARLAMIAMNQVCANPNCGQMFVDATNAANALTGSALTISLPSICAKVPVIGVAAVTAGTAPAPIGTVTPVATTPAAPTVTPAPVTPPTTAPAAPN